MQKYPLRINDKEGPMPQRKPLVAAALALACLPSAGQAAEWYATASTGRSQTSRDLVANRESTLVDATGVHTEFDAKDSAWKIGAGYRFNPVLAIEVNYADLGRHSTFTTMLAGAPAAFASIAIERKVTGFGADLVVSAPVAERFSIYGRVGAFRTNLEASAQLGGNIVFTNGATEDTRRSVTQHETVLRYGVGAAWQLWRNGALHIEWERYSDIGKAFAIGGSGTTGEADTNVAWIGVTQRF
jgi:opacity protein-like surface antigen